MHGVPQRRNSLNSSWQSPLSKRIQFIVEQPVQQIDDPQNHVAIETGEKVGSAFGRRVRRLTTAIMTLATVAIAFVYFAGAGQTQNEHNQVYGESFDLAHHPLLPKN
jgi:hypothetical protein